MHIGIILDGNRRFAKKLLNPNQLWKGHEAGAEKFEKILDWIKEFDIHETTLYCFSVENFKRSKQEVSFLMDLFKKEIRKLGADRRIDDYDVKVKFAGKRELLNAELCELMKEIEEKTKSHKEFILNFALAYGGRQEIIHAVKQLVKNNEEINEENITKNLWIPEEPDFIIRTGNEKRMSNFLPWQSVYSEWIFLDKMWPEFTKQDLENSIKEFKSRERRYGK